MSRILNTTSGIQKFKMLHEKKIQFIELTILVLLNLCLEKQ